MCAVIGAQNTHQREEITRNRSNHAGEIRLDEHFHTIAPVLVHAIRVEIVEILVKVGVSAET